MRMSAGRPVKRPSRFPVPEVFKSSSAAEFGGDLFSEKACLDAVKKPVRAYALPEQEPVAVDAYDPGGSESVGLRETNCVAVDRPV